MRNKNPQKQKLLIGLIVLLILGALAALVYISNRDNNSANEQSDGNVQSPQDMINLEPPTSQEQEAGDAIKPQLPDADSEPQNGNSGDRTVDLVITDASQYDDTIEVRSFVANYIEDGTCTMTFSLGNETITRETVAKADASTTLCLTLNVPRADFPKSGNWKLKVSYDDGKSASGSAETTVVIE